VYDIVNVDFVIKFLHGIKAWALSYSEQCVIFGQDLKGGNSIVCFPLNS
jgi:hypothetical protein